MKRGKNTNSETTPSKYLEESSDLRPRSMISLVSDAPPESVLIVNRGEIACRIIRTARALGLKSISLYSYADRHALHVRQADAALQLGPSDSYLNIGEIIEIILKVSPTFVHPGYGFLSENSEFAHQVTLTTSKFLGPTPEVISLMGDKVAARELAISLDIPVVPGTTLDLDTISAKSTASQVTTRKAKKGEVQSTKLDESPSPNQRVLSEADAKSIIEKIDLPLMIKAAHGGGGRGMRRVYKEVDLIPSLTSASRESKQFFNSDKLFIERLIERPRHLEVQAIGDKYGNVRILGDRDCSLQRSHQKIIEEAPAPFISSDIRKMIFEYTEKMFKTSQYIGVGTAEFLLSTKGELFFLEVNSRLQVEHCVTEMVTGLDIVDLQFRIARGESLKKLLPADPKSSGAAIEIRLCAEKPFLGFTPSSGKLLAFELEGDRVDSGFIEGDTVSPLYDSLLAKVINYGPTRDEAISRSISSLKTSLVAGVETNQDLLLKIIESPKFSDGDLSTDLISNLLEEHQPLEYQVAICSVAGWLKSYFCQTNSQQPHNKSSRFFQFNDIQEIFREYSIFNKSPIWSAQIYGMTVTISIKSVKADEGVLLKVSINEEKIFNFACRFTADLANTQELSAQHSLRQEPSALFTLEACRFNELGQDVSDLINNSRYIKPDWLRIGSSTVHIRKECIATSATSKSQIALGALSSIVRSPLPGRIIHVQAELGAIVKKGEPLATIESMKMEHIVIAPRDGKITKLQAQEGMTVESNAILAEISN